MRLMYMAYHFIVDAMLYWSLMPPHLYMLFEGRSSYVIELCAG